MTTGDARLIALNARTGDVVWDTQVMDPKEGYTYTAGALAVKGVIISSLTGCQRFKNDTCYILGHDAQTGKELWRTSTIARPGEPGGDTWDNQPLMFRAGGDAWMTGSYDPATNLVYWGTSQAKPWAQFQRGTAGDALYTNSTLALDPKTGKMAWYFQHIPGETHDMDEVFERVLVDVDGRPSSFSMGKLAILWQIDRKTGKFVAAHDPGYQTLIDVDPKTGRAAYRANTIPKEGVEFRFCPSTGGFKSLRSMAYHPATRAFYIPLNLTCEDGTFGADQAGGRRRRLGTGAPHQPDASGEPRRPWRAARDGRQRKDPLAASHAHAAEHLGADDGRRSRARRTLGSVLPHPRRGDRQDSLHEPAHADARAGIPDHVRRQRQTVRRRARRHRRRLVVEQHRHRHDSRGAHSAGDEFDLRVRALRRQGQEIRKFMHLLLFCPHFFRIFP